MNCVYSVKESEGMGGDVEKCWKMLKNVEKLDDGLVRSKSNRLLSPSWKFKGIIINAFGWMNRIDLHASDILCNHEIKSSTRLIQQQNYSIYLSTILLEICNLQHQGIVLAVKRPIWLL